MEPPNPETFQIQRVGHVEDESSRIVRIIHISDTHMEHDYYRKRIPDGDIIIHSGDFVDWFDRLSLEQSVNAIDSFFADLPHKHKIFVAGNHEFSLYVYRKRRVDKMFQHVTYLRDKSINVEGIHIHGSPWTTSRGMGFYKSNRKGKWSKIPHNTDILVTHGPPYGISDLGYDKFDDSRRFCKVCTESNTSGEEQYHTDYWHQGCEDLHKAIFTKIRPKAHLFGHVHNQHGFKWEDGILFSNAALPCTGLPLVIDYHLKQQPGSHKLMKAFKDLEISA